METMIDRATFVEKFDRLGRGENFSVAARHVLFDHIKQGLGATSDIVGLCCEYGEWDVQDLCDYFEASEILAEEDDVNDLEAWAEGLERDTTVLRVYNDLGEVKSLILAVF